MRRAVTLIELLLVLVLVGALCAIAIPRVARHIDRVHVRHAVNEIVTALALARSTAVARASPVATRFVAERTLIITADDDTLMRRELGALHGVRIRSNRDSTVYGATGLGHGAANQTVIVERGRAVDSVIVSRLGRVRH